MKTVCVIGCIGKGTSLLNGQTIKTKILITELIREYGEENVLQIDTWGLKNLIFLLPRMFFAIIRCKNIIILPAHNGMRIIPSTLAFFNKLCHRSLHYDVIGGWLPIYLTDKPKLRKCLKKFKGIYVELSSMKNDLQGMGFDNVYVVPNCKDLSVIKEEDLNVMKRVPYRFATFSRVMKAKGIEDAIDAVLKINKQLGSDVFGLDVYGQIEEKDKDWFSSLLVKIDGRVISYGGAVSFDQSAVVLCKYYGLLFPSYYEGEGFAGTLIDAFAAGLPVVASDWKYNAEIVRDHREGIIVSPKDVDGIVSAFSWIYNNSKEWESYRLNCIRRAIEYSPAMALKTIKNNLLG